MNWSFVFVLNSVLLGVGLAMDAFSVSLANGLGDPGMSRRRMAGIAGTFAGFQAFMPMTGWVLVHTVVRIFGVFERFIPWIALLLLGWIGGKMLYEGIRERRNADREDAEARKAGRLGIGALLLQGVATSIDALSVGFTIADYEWPMALAAALIIAAVTFVICMGGLRLGKTFGTRLAGRASILGGLILIAIGIEIFVSSMIR
ncbi:MAG: manganese efflux pump [Clostridia bacterium]|nr:manganese efflux pump [Clostridia bacterium]MCR4905304.1 manganese efflux pump MntP family protein [Clostridiales bacterium]